MSNKDVVIQVGNGRGFVTTAGNCDALVVLTAAHCLPFFPPCMSASYLSERSYENLLGPIGHDRTIWAECLFVDPVSDIAVLGSPDDQDLYERAVAYLKFIEQAPVIELADAKEGQARMLSLRGDWFPCSVSVQSGFDGRSFLWVTESTEAIVGGMSGSPIMADDHAIGMVCTSCEERPGERPGPSTFAGPLSCTAVHAGSI